MNSKQMLISVSAALVIAGLHAVPSYALPPEGTFNYVVDHPALGDVGLNENTVTHDGNRIIIESKGNLLAKLAVGAAVLGLLPWMVWLLELSPGSLTQRVANAHTGFNLLLGLAGLPLVEVISRFVERMVPQPATLHRKAFGPRYINLTSPVDSVALALGQSRQEILHMSEIVRAMLSDLWRALKTNDERLARQVSQRDDEVDLLDDQIKRFLVRVVSMEKDSANVSEQMRQLRYLVELETIGDIIDKNLSELVLKKISLRVEFSSEGWQELEDFYEKVAENVMIAETACTTRDRQLAEQLVRHKERLHLYEHELRDRHFARLNAGLVEAHETSAIHLDFLTHLKRINSCVSHIGFAILKAAEMEEERAAPEG